MISVMVLLLFMMIDDSDHDHHVICCDADRKMMSVLVRITDSGGPCVANEKGADPNAVAR